MIEAGDRGADLAVFVVHSFSCPSFDAESVGDNDACILSFFAPLISPPAPLVADLLHGPLRVPGSAHIPQMPLLAGSVTTPIPPYPQHRRARSSPTVLARLRNSFYEALRSSVLAEAVGARRPIPARPSRADCEAAL